MVKKISIIIFLLIILSNSMIASDLLNIEIIQVTEENPYINVYMNFTASDNTLIEDISIFDYELEVKIDNKDVEIEGIKPFSKSKSGIGYVFLLDISKSINKNRFKNIINNINGFIDDLKHNDKVSIITFGEEVNIIKNYTSDKLDLKNCLNKLSTTDSGTRFYDGINKAMELSLQEDTSVPKRRAIIVVTDGKEDFGGGITKKEILKKLEKTTVPIYAIGIYENPLTEEKQKHLDNLGEIARSSNGRYFQLGTFKLSEIFTSIKRNINSTHVIKLKSDSIFSDDYIHTLNIRLKIGSKTLSAISEFEGFLIEENKIDTTIEEVDMNTDKSLLKSFLNTIIDNHIYIYIGAFLILILIVTIYLIWNRKKQEYIEEFTDDEMPLKNNNINKEYKKSIPKIKESQKNEITFTVIDSKEEKQSYNVKMNNKIIIGRSKDCNLTFKDPDLSRKQCEIFIIDDNLYIRDLNSSNGTYVNGVPVKEMFRLEDNDIILVGQTELRINFKYVMKNAF